jgi:hypothetical protein
LRFSAQAQNTQNSIAATQQDIRLHHDDAINSLDDSSVYFCSARTLCGTVVFLPDAHGM